MWPSDTFGVAAQEADEIRISTVFTRRRFTQFRETWKITFYKQNQMRASEL